MTLEHGSGNRDCRPDIEDPATSPEAELTGQAELEVQGAIARRAAPLEEEGALADLRVGGRRE